MAEETTATNQDGGVTARSEVGAPAGAGLGEKESRGRRRRLVGRVVNDTHSEGRTKKTIVVEVVRKFRDPFYGKYVKKKMKYHAHDEREQFQTRDLVEIRACRPRSKTKRWEVTRLLERPPEV